MTIKKILDGYRSGTLKPSEFIDTCLNKISSDDKRLNSFLCLNSEIKAKASNLDNNKVFDDKAKLLGVPIAIKDNIMVKDMPCTCASKILSNHVASYNATVVEKLNTSGALIIGKNNMDEFAMGSTTENSAFGPTRNPINNDFVPGGSSGGSAASVASGMVPASLGSDTGGSVRQPASFCGIVGYKPSYGLVSRYGLVAFGSSLDQIGTLTRTCEDAALLTSVISGIDRLDSTSVDVKPDNISDFQPVSVKGKRFALIKETMSESTDEPVRNVIESYVLKIKSLGGIVEVVSVPELEYAVSIYYIIAPAEASSNLARFDGIRYGLRTTKEGVDAKSVFTATRDEGFGEEVKRRIIIGNFVLSSGYYDAYYKKAQKARIILTDKINQLFESYDFLLTPTSPVLPFKLGSTIDDPLKLYVADICTIPANLAGLPAVSIPAGMADGLPVGIQLMGQRFKDGIMLGVGETLCNS